MPYKIVQTIERGKTFLSCVPSGWECDNILLWPRKGSKKLQKNEDSQPGDDWISSTCQVKRSGLTYDEAQSEILRMERASDTEEERVPRHQRHQLDIDFNDITMECLKNKENISPTSIFPVLEHEQVPYNKSNASVHLNVRSDPAENATFVTNEAPYIVQQGSESETGIRPENPYIVQQESDHNTVYFISPEPPEKLNFQEIVLKRLEKIENTQNKLVLQLSQVGAQMEAFFRVVQQQKFNSQIEFNVINSIEELQNFNDELKDTQSVGMYKEKLSLVCGSEKGNGLNNCFALIDVMFSRRFLTECSWAGGSKKAQAKKHCFKAYSRVIDLFFEVIRHSDKTFTLLECESFFKNILRNSERRYAAKMLRASATKKRAKGKGLGKKSGRIQENADTQPNRTGSLTVPLEATISLDPQPSTSGTLQDTYIE